MKPWKNFRTNMMYWRFRYVTRNRLRLQAWRNSRTRVQRVPPAFRERGLASSYGPYRTDSRRLWVILLVMVILLTALQATAQQIVIAPGLVYGIGTLIVALAVYAALKFG